VRVKDRESTCNPLCWPAARTTKSASSPTETSLLARVTKQSPAVQGSQVPRPERPRSHRCVSEVCSATQSDSSEPTAPRPPTRSQISGFSFSEVCSIGFFYLSFLWALEYMWRRPPGSQRNQLYPEEFKLLCTFDFYWASVGSSILQAIYCPI